MPSIYLTTFGCRVDHLSVSFHSGYRCSMLCQENESWIQWLPLVSLALRRLRQEGCCEFGASLGYRARPCLKKKTIKQIAVAKSYSDLKLGHILTGQNVRKPVSFLYQGSIIYLQAHLSLSIFINMPFWAGLSPESILPVCKVKGRNLFSQWAKGEKINKIYFLNKNFKNSFLGQTETKQTETSAELACAFP